jgi:predicted nucleic acid-binding protein
MAGEQALLFVDNVRSRLHVVALDPLDYYESIKSAAAADIFGGTIYDMLLAQCALKVDAETIYTWDSHDFARLGQEVAKRVRTP